MANKDPAATPLRASDMLDKKSATPETAARQDHRGRSARPDPETEDVRAGPGDAGLQDRPELNAGSSGTKQMSNRRLAIGLGIGALLAILVFIFAAIF